MTDEKFKNKYRISSTRLAGYDYSQNGLYFVTICTKDRIEYFGNIKNGQMNLSALGRAADECWRAISAHFPFVVLGEFIIMPNHVHGILEINRIVETQDFASLPNTFPPFREQTQNLASLPACRHDTETQNLASLPKIPEYKNKFGPQSKNLSSIIRGFKIGVTKFAKNNNLPFGWQERFYDHIIRNEESLMKIRQYILDNPTKWERDRNSPSNLLM